MKKFFIAAVSILLAIATGFSAAGPAATVGISAISEWNANEGTNAFTADATHKITGATQKLGIKFFPPHAETVNNIDVYLTVGGTLTGITIKAEIETDSSDAPSGTVVGSTSAAFACPTASGWTGLQSVGSASLSANTPYWLVLFDGGGTAPTSSNFYQPTTSCATTGSEYMSLGGVRQHNGTNWTTTARRQFDCAWVRQLSDSTYRGYAQQATAGTSVTQPKIFSTNRHGLVFQAGGLLDGVILRVGKGATPPNGLEVALFQGAGSTALETVTLTSSSMVASGQFEVYTIGWSKKYLLRPGVNYYITLHQASDGGSSTNYYVCFVQKINSTYVSAMEPANWRAISGTNTDPSQLTTDTSEVPYIIPIIESPTTDLTTRVGF